MPIYESSKDYCTGVVLMFWDGDKPSDNEFFDHAKNEYGTAAGTLKIDYPTDFRGTRNPGTARVTPNAVGQVVNVDAVVSRSFVFLLTTGDGSDGDEWQVVSIHRTKESAEKAKVEYEKPRPRLTTGFYARTANIEEWDVEG